MNAFLITHADQSEKVASAVAECRRLGIEILPPDINRSQTNFTIEKDGRETPVIRFGLTAIKNVGSGAVAPIIAEREKGGEYKSVEDLCRRADLNGLNRRVLESLIKVGALDSLGDRGALLQNANNILSLAQRQQQLRQTGQSTMFDLWGEKMPVPIPSLDLATAEISLKEKLGWEKELMGAYLSEHPFSAFADKVGSETTLCGQIDAELAGQTVVVAGLVVSAHHLFTREQKPFVSAILEDLSGSIEIMVWPKIFADTKELWQEGNILEVGGRVRVREERVQINCDQVRQYQPEAAPLELESAPPPAELPEAAKKAAKKVVKKAAEETAAAPEKGRRLVIHLTQTSDAENDITYLNKLINILKDFPGYDEVSLRITNGEKVFTLKLPDLTIDYCPELQKRLVEVVGEKGINIEQC
jgi:DNA polymerase-3 subunit alpha